GNESAENHGSVHGDEEDKLTYTWSATGGSFKDGKNTGLALVWEAPVTNFDPNATNEYTITCTIQDEPKVVTAPDTPIGVAARNDDAVAREFTVRVVDDTSWMELNLYKEKTDAQPISGVTGGKVWIAVDIQIGGETNITA